MKKVADASKPPAVIPAVVVTAHDDVPLAAPTAERSELYRTPSVSPPIEYSLSCIAFGVVYACPAPRIFIF